MNWWFHKSWHERNELNETNVTCHCVIAVHIERTPYIFINKQILFLHYFRKKYPNAGRTHALRVRMQSETFSRSCLCFQVDKAADGTTTVKKLMGVIYVPLTDKEKQYREWPIYNVLKYIVLFCLGTILCCIILDLAGIVNVGSWVPGN